MAAITLVASPQDDMNSDLPCRTKDLPERFDKRLNGILAWLPCTRLEVPGPLLSLCSRKPNVAKTQKVPTHTVNLSVILLSPLKFPFPQSPPHFHFSVAPFCSLSVFTLRISVTLPYSEVISAHTASFSPLLQYLNKSVLSPLSSVWFLFDIFNI